MRGAFCGQEIAGGGWRALAPGQSVRIVGDDAELTFRDLMPRVAHYCSREHARSRTVLYPEAVTDR